MNCEENKRTVIAGLDRRRMERLEAKQEARLERYEQDQLHAISENCTSARMKREAEEASQRILQQTAAKRAARAAELAEAQERKDDSIRAIQYYVLVCLGVMWLTTFTYLPIWAAVTLALGLGVFPAAYIFRLYFPADEEQSYEDG